MKSLDKVLDVLEVFLELETDSIRLSELTKHTNLNKATVNRIVTNLVKRGYLSQPEKRGKYHLGSKFLNFNRIITQKRQLRQIALQHMTELAASIGECVFLAVYEEERTIISEIVESKALLRTAPLIGTQVPMYCTAVGKVILANMTKSELDKYLKETTLVQHTEFTITDPDEFRSHLQLVAREGVAFDDEEQYLGIRNVAAPIINSDGKVKAALGVLGPSVRLTQSRMKEIAPEVKAFAGYISAELGYQQNTHAKSV